MSDWLSESPVQGPAALAGVYALITMLSIPGFPFAAASGVAFMNAYDRATGKVVIIGGIAVWAGANVGSNLALLLARYLFRK